MRSLREEAGQSEQECRPRSRKGLEAGEGEHENDLRSRGAGKLLEGRGGQDL